MDVVEWKFVVPEGIQKHGLMDAALGFHRNAVFEVEDSFFREVEMALTKECAVPV